MVRAIIDRLTLKVIFIFSIILCFYSNPLSAQDCGDLCVPVYNSYPEASETIYLMFDGEVPYSMVGGDDDPNAFNQQELEEIKYIWERVAEKFRPFPVNVTTDPQRYEDATLTDTPRTSVYIKTPGIGGTSGSYFSASGGGFVTAEGSEPHHIAGKAGHELEHSFRMHHSHCSDRNEVFWESMTGGGRNDSLVQWSKSECMPSDFGDRQREPLEIISSVELNAIGYKTDDHGDTYLTATPFTSAMLKNGEIDVNRHTGIIERNTDRDLFKLRLTGGTVDLTISPTVVGHGTLHAYAELYSADGTLVAHSDPLSIIADIDTTITTPGFYYLLVDGIGRGNPEENTGYSDYGSIGGYVIRGSFPEDTLNPPRLTKGLTRIENPSGGAEVEFQGLLQVPEDSLYSFDSASLAAVKFIVGNDVVLDMGSNSGPVYLSAGLHPVRASYFAGSSLTFDIRYAERGIRQKRIPNEVLYPFNPVPAEPIARDDRYTLIGENLTIPASTGVLFNDYDENGETLTASLSQNPSNGSVILQSDGSFSYTPDPGFAGGQTDSFGYLATDGSSTAEAKVEIQVWGDYVNFHEFDTEIYTRSGVPSYGRKIEDNGNRLKITDTDYSKKINLPYKITPNTVLSFDLNGDPTGKAYQIGFIDNFTGVDPTKLFVVAGTAADNSSGTFSGMGNLREYAHGFGRYRIPVGNHYLGEMQNIVFGNIVGKSAFSNVRVFESEDTSFSFTPTSNAFIPPRETGLAQNESMSTITRDLTPLEENVATFGLMGIVTSAEDDWLIEYTVVGNTNESRVSATTTYNNAGSSLKLSFAQEDLFSYITLQAATSKGESLALTFRVDWDDSEKQYSIKDYNDIVSAVRGEVLEGIDLLANDPASAIITQYDTVSSQGGSITQNADGITFDYTPPAGFYGIDTFRYVIAEADAESLSLLVTIHVRPSDGVEEISIAVDDLMTYNPEDGIYRAVLDVLANDILLNSQTTIHSFDTVSERGATISLENGLMVYSSNVPFEKDRFTYTLIDPTTNQLSLPATVEVIPVIFHEPFENAGVLSDYTAYEETYVTCGPDINSRWTVDAGSLVVTDSCGRWWTNGSVGSLLIKNTDVFGDGTYYIDIGGPGSDNDHLGLVFGFRDVNNYYRVYASQEHRKIYLTEMSEGTLYAIATIDYLTVNNEATKNLSITLDQNSYAINYNNEVSLEGELTGEVSAEFAPGQIGIYGAWMASGQFDNLMHQPAFAFEDLSGAYTFQAAGGDLANRYIWAGSGSFENGPGVFDNYNHLVGGGTEDTITWTLSAVPGESETYTIQSHYHGLYMDGDDSEAFDYSYDDRFEDTIVSRPAQHDDSQKWIVRRLANGHVTIQEKTNSYFLSNDFYIQKTVADDSGNVEWIATPQPENAN